MAKRKLTKQQRYRVKNQQRKRKPLETSDSPVDESTLSPPTEGLVIARYGMQADIEPVSLESEATTVRRCHIRANLDDLVCGDRVVWQQDQQGAGVVVAIDERSSLLSRPDSRGLSKSIAANISQMVIVIAPYPEVYHNVIDRFLVAAHHFNIKACIAVNKIDLLSKEDKHLHHLLTTYKNLGYPLIEVSAEQKLHLDPLREQLKGHTSIFVGQSGVGKSSLINSLLPDVQTTVGEVSSATGKGKHTTTAAMLYHFPFGGDLIDSPGIREFSLWQVPNDSLEASFPELRQLSEHCQFRDCSHLNEPGCAVKKGLDNGSIERARFESFLRIKESMIEAPKRD